MELLLSVALKTTKRKSWTFYVECSWETEFSCAVAGTQDRWPIKIKSFFPFPMESGLPMLPGVGGDDKKNKRPYLCFWFARWWKASLLFFPSRVDSFNSQSCFHETQGRSDNSTGKKKKSPPQFSFWEQSDEKNISEVKTGGLFRFILTSENKHVLCTFTEHGTSGQSRVSLCFVHTPAKHSQPTKEQASETCDL